LKISFVIVTWNCLRQIQECLRTLIELAVPESEIIVLDAASHDGTREFLETVQGIQFRPLSFKDSWSNNNRLGISMAKGDWICVMNPDIYFNQSFQNVLRVLDGLEEPYPFVTPQLVYPDQKEQDGFQILRFSNMASVFTECGYVISKYMKRFQFTKGLPNGDGTVKVWHPRGSMFIVHRRTVELMGELWRPTFTLCVADSDMFRLAYEKQIEILLVPSARLVHEEGHATKKQARPELDWEMNYGLILYARYWKEHPRVLTVIYLLDAVLAFLVIPAISVLKSKRKRAEGGRPRVKLTLSEFLTGHVRRSAGKISGLVAGWSVKL